MVRIRKARFLDKFKLKKMISFLSTDAVNQYTKVLLDFPFKNLHSLLPLRWKFLPESYVIEDAGEIIGMITLAPASGNPYKLTITRLFLDHDYFNAGKQLVDFVISKYGASGASAFLALIDDSHDELIHLFVDGCGFRQCSCEQLWKMENFHVKKQSTTFFRPFKNSDAQAVAMLFNDSVIQHFKHSISRTKSEYHEPLFYGLKNSVKFKYVVEDDNLKTIKAYFSITTEDDSNYILDVTSSPWYDCSWEDIMNFAIKQISRRKKEFYLFVKLKKFTTTSENFEKFLVDNNFKCIQNQLILVKDFYKVIKETEPSKSVLLFSDVLEKPVFKI